MNRDIPELPRQDEAIRDGIAEEDNKIPLWFNVGFYGMIVFGVIYIFVYTLGSWSQVGLAIDVANATTVGSPGRYVAEVEGDWIVHVHLSDSRAGAVHLPLGEGDLDIKALLAALQQKYDGLVIIEGYVPGRGEEVAAHDIGFLRNLGFMPHQC